MSLFNEPQFLQRYFRIFVTMTFKYQSQWWSHPLAGFPTWAIEKKLIQMDILLLMNQSPFASQIEI